LGTQTAAGACLPARFRKEPIYLQDEPVNIRNLVTRIEIHLKHAKEFINLGAAYDNDVAREFHTIAEIAHSASEAVAEGNYEKQRPADYTFIDDSFNDDATPLAVAPQADTG
jgi:hypothetical protein